MQNPATPTQTLDQALATLAAMNPQPTAGKWLEEITVAVAPHLKNWDIAQCWGWADWPDREKVFPRTDRPGTDRLVDIGIDAVAVRRSDGQFIAIQCKARQLDAAGHGNDIIKDEVDRFTAASVNPIFAERWLVTNGDNRISANAQQMASMSSRERPIKLVNIHADILDQWQANAQAEPDFPGQPADDADADTDTPPRQTKSAMQAEAVAQSVRILKEHAAAESGGHPPGQARGKIILPCGAGKTRVSLRIVEELTPPGGLAIVLCPSIALVAQIRREYLQHSAQIIRPLAVCSDQTAGYDPKKESARNTASDPTADNSNVSAAEVKGRVTTDPAEIGQWIQAGQDAAAISVIFGTYQSGHRIAAALQETGTTASVLIADEAHRTAGLRRKRNSQNRPLSQEEQNLRDFTLCHDNDAFPATYRVYQTATPRIYDGKRLRREDPAADWIVRSMDDETVFGVELYRKSYGEAVSNGWLADYRIIALGVNDPAAYEAANLLAERTESLGKQALTTRHYLRGLAFALAMGGATRNPDGDPVPIQSCIAFMNTVDKSKNMARDLARDEVTTWLRGWLQQHLPGQAPAGYTLEHLDATDNVAARENAKQQLAAALPDQPHGILNVGIFGEGTDSPSLSAVAFLEPRKSPIDVIQAVGRAMRTAPGKETGYIICPILIPPHADPEKWLSASAPEEGWSELGQILLALRAHDQRIEDNLADLLQLYIPQPPPVERHIIALATEQGIQYREHIGPPDSAPAAILRALDNPQILDREFQPIPAQQPETPPPALTLAESSGNGYSTGPAAPPLEPVHIISGKKNADGSKELRIDTVRRAKSAADGAPGPVDYAKTQAHGQAMINNDQGNPLAAVPPQSRPQPRPRPEPPQRTEPAQPRPPRPLPLPLELGNAITVNLLAKSGLAGNRVIRDLNILEVGINEAAHQLRSDELLSLLNRHFGLDNLTPESRSKQADGCTIAALLMMNAAMLHQRIANGQWLSRVNSLSYLKNDVDVAKNIRQQWELIMRRDFHPVLEPAVDAIDAIENTGKLAGLNRCLRHIAAEAERIAETYADLGADHAGPLFNRVMGNQASDGAFFTRPPAAALAARLTLDCLPPNADWTDETVWRDCKAVDLACGSGTLLAALLTAMKNRAATAGATPDQIAARQKLAVEDTLKGLDINPVSLQLAAAQLTAGNRDIRYRQMGLHKMPYGPQADNPGRVAAGTLELLGQQAIVPRPGAMNLGDDQIQSRAVWQPTDDADLEDAVAAVQNARIVIMNPPFTNRASMGEKFPKPIQQALRQRTDDMEQILVRSDRDLENFVDKNSIAPLFAALADKCVRPADGVLTLINPTIALSSPAAFETRRILAQRYHIHTILSCHQPGQVNLSQNTGINESIIVMRRHNDGPKPPTRFINLDRMPIDDAEVDELHQCLAQCQQGSIPEGWGEVSDWPAERMDAGDWTPALWRSPELAAAAARFAEDPALPTLEAAGLSPAATGQQLRGSYERAAAGLPGGFFILGSKAEDGQTHIESRPDEYWIPKKRDESIRQANGGTYPEVDRILQKAGYLLITAGQNNSTARLTATAADDEYVGNGWMPVDGLTPPQAKALAVFLNSTPGRLQLMRNQGRTLVFPIYSAAEAARLRIPDLQDARVCKILADCWEATRQTSVPQFRAGECPVRRQWDAAVAAALAWDADYLTRLRQLLHREPHVRGLGYNQYGVAAATGPATD